MDLENVIDSSTLIKTHPLIQSRTIQFQYLINGSLPNMIEFTIFEVTSASLSH